jgi:hypothetical protein
MVRRSSDVLAFVLAEFDETFDDPSDSRFSIILAWIGPLQFQQILGSLGLSPLFHFPPQVFEPGFLLDDGAKHMEYSQREFFFISIEF